MSGNEASTGPLIRVRDLAVQRGERLLFKGLGFELSAGQVLLLRGANGAGKSSLLMALAGILRPESGEIRRAEEAGLHLLTYQHGLKARLTVAENLHFWQALYGGPGLTIPEALERVGIAALAGLETGYLSSGQTRRLSLARLLVSERPIWLLDEPSATLDAAGEKLLGTLIDAHRQKGGAAVIATHHDLPLAYPAGIETIVLGAAS